MYLETSYIRVAKTLINQQKSGAPRRYHYNIRLLSNTPEAYVQNRLALEDILKIELHNPFSEFSWVIDERQNKPGSQFDFYSQSNRHALSSLFDLIYHPDFGQDIQNKQAHIKGFLTNIRQRITPEHLTQFLAATSRTSFDEKDIDISQPNSKLRGLLEIVKFLNKPGSLTFPDSHNEGFLLSNLAKKENSYHYNKAEGKNEAVGVEIYEKIVDYLFKDPATPDILKFEKKAGYTCADIAAFSENLTFLKLLFQHYPNTQTYFTKKKISDYQFRDKSVELFMSSHLERQALDKYVAQLDNNMPDNIPVKSAFAQKFKL